MTRLLKSVLDTWPLPDHGISVYDPQEAGIKEFTFAEAEKWCEFSGSFGPNCRVFTNPSRLTDNSRLKIRGPGPAQPSDNINIVFLKCQGSPMISMNGSNNNIFLGNYGYQFAGHIAIAKNTNILVGDRATSNGATIFLDNSDVVIGADSMLSSEIILQPCDQHGIVDLKTGSIVNNTKGHILIGEHVWVGRRASIMKDVTIGKGAIVAFGALVTADVEPCTIAGGVPAKTIRRNVSWSRMQARVMPNELDFLDPPG